VKAGNEITIKWQVTRAFKGDHICEYNVDPSTVVLYVYVTLINIIPLCLLILEIADAAT